MRAALAAVAYLLSLGLMGIPAYKWGWVIAHLGIQEAWDELTTSKANLRANGATRGVWVLVSVSGRAA